MSPVSITAPRKISFLFLHPKALAQSTQILLRWLEDCGLKGHIGSREIAGEKLGEELETEISNSFHTILLYGPTATPTDQAMGELLRVAAKRRDGFKVWPLLLDGAPLPDSRRPGTKDFKARALTLRTDSISHSVPAMLRGLIPTWTRAHFLSNYWLIDEHLDRGNDDAARAVARELFNNASAAGTGAYDEAAFDVPLSRILLARSLHRTGETAESLELLRRAHEQILEMQERPVPQPSETHSAAFLELAECVMDMKMTREATKLYVDAVRAAEAEGALRHLAIAKGQLAQIRVAQERPAEAVALCEDVVGIFRQLGDQPSLRRAWEQLGSIHREAGDLNAAFEAYHQAYLVSPDAAVSATMAELAAKRLDYAGAAVYATKASELATDPMEQQRARLDAVGYHAEAGNVAGARALLDSIGEAEDSGEPWRLHEARHKVESAAGNAEAAAAARRSAIELFASHRRKGGDNPYPSGQVTNFIVFAVAGGSGEMALEQIQKTIDSPKTTERAKAYLTALSAVVGGSRDPQLATDPQMTYDEAAEVLVLMDALS